VICNTLTYHQKTKGTNKHSSRDRSGKQQANKEQVTDIPLGYRAYREQETLQLMRAGPKP
jgi:hypothetical protein